jgi:small nuclear ribonucleoprotein G
MNLVVDNTVEVNGNDKTDIGMVVGFLLLIVWKNFEHVPQNALVINMYHHMLTTNNHLQVIRGNSVVMIEALEPVAKAQ